MQRLESANPTPKELYQQICADYQELTQLFGRQDYPNAPDLTVVYDKTRRSKSKVNYYLRFQPGGMSTERKTSIEAEILHNGIPYANRYVSQLHFVALDNNGMDDDGIDSIEAHEVTHSVVTFRDEDEGILKVDAGQLNGLRIPPWYHGQDVYRLRDQLKDPSRIMELDMDEFYTPLGEAHLLQEKYKPESYYGFPQRLPQLAGALFAELYGRNIRALVMEHPQVAHLSVNVLWEKYCKPLLTGNFKI